MASGTNEVAWDRVSDAIESNSVQMWAMAVSNEKNCACVGKFPAEIFDRSSRSVSIFSGSWTTCVAVVVTLLRSGRYARIFELFSQMVSIMYKLASLWGFDHAYSHIS